MLNSYSDSVALCLKGAGALYGIKLLNSKHGVVVDCIGNNGATYSSYLNIGGFARQLTDLKPQLVIISLGTNEAYGSLTSVESNIDRLVKSISQECPGVKLLLTTPLETHKRSGRGYVVQSGVAAVRDIIMNYCKKHHIAVWDFYTVAGGKGAASRWLAPKYMKSDHLHLTDRGYHFMGRLLGEALMNLLTGKDDGSTVPDVVPVPEVEDDDNEEGEQGDVDDGEMKNEESSKPQ